MSNMCDLPDVVKEVLVRVSGEMVPTLKCVSKSWQTLVDRKPQLFLLSNDNRLYMSGCMDSPEKMKASLTQIEPTTKDEETLNALELLPFDEGGTEDGKVSFGFGYDKVCDDYKVVRLQKTWKSRHQVKVYSLKSKCWRDVGEISYYPVFQSCVFANGALHWLMITRDVNDHVILALDLSTEKYHRVPLPMEVDYRGLYDIDSFEAVDGFLSLVIHARRDKYHRVEVWTMKKYGVEDSWTKLPDLRIRSKHFWENLDSGIERNVKPLMHWNKFLMFGSVGNLIWHDTQSKVDELIVSSSDPSCCTTWKQAVAFTPSLVHLPVD